MLVLVLVLELVLLLLVPLLLLYYHHAFLGPPTGGTPPRLCGSPPVYFSVYELQQSGAREIGSTVGRGRRCGKDRVPQAARNAI